MQGLATSKSRGSATIVDVARMSGLSTATVSRVLTGTTNGQRVRDVTRNRVLRAAEQLGYHPHYFARALARGHGNSIGLLFEGDTPSLGSIHQKIVSSFAATLHRNGYQLLFIPVNEKDRTWREMLLGGHLEGCVCIGTVHPAVRKALGESDLPAVILNADVSCGRPRVLADDKDASLRLTKYLLDLGHREIVFHVGPPSDLKHYSVAEREAGFVGTLLAAGHRADERVLHCTVEQLVSRLMSDLSDVSAVIAYSHYDAIPLLHTLWNAGWRVPDDISVVSFNDLFPVEHTVPPLTTMSVMPERMGWIGAALLLRQLRGGERHARRQVVRLKEQLVLRGSASRHVGGAEP
jgi:LacI family transcriptional regulator